MTDLARMTAGGLMTSPVFAVRQDALVAKVAGTLSSRRISGALVVDGSGKPVGVISLMDIARHASMAAQAPDIRSGFYSYPDAVEASSWRAPSRDVHVAAVMSPEIISVSEDLPLLGVVEMMSGNHIHRLFVTRGDHPVGVITSMDVLRLLTAGRVIKGRKASRQRA